MTLESFEEETTLSQKHTGKSYILVNYITTNSVSLNSFLNIKY